MKKMIVIATSNIVDHATAHEMILDICDTLMIVILDVDMVITIMDMEAVTIAIVMKAIAVIEMIINTAARPCIRVDRIIVNEDVVPDVKLVDLENHYVVTIMVSSTKNKYYNMFV